MKTFTYTAMLLAIVAVAVRCTEDGYVSKSQVQIGVNLVGKDGQSMPEGSFLLLDIVNSLGESVIDDRKIKVMVDDQIVSIPIDLPAGNYRLTDLAVVDESSGLMHYAVPELNAPLSAQVDHTLDFEFSVEKGKTTRFNFNLLDVSKNTPAAFGFSSFKVSATQLKVTVKADGIQKAISADAYIVQGSDTIDHFVLDAKMNSIPLRGNSMEAYTLVISKSGYLPYVKQFTEQEVKGKPLVALLERRPAFNMLAYVDDLNFNYEFTFELDFTGTISVDWGDNSRDTTIVAATPTRGWFDHFYPAAGNYPITVTGDVQNITMFYSAYGQGPLDGVDFAPLVNLDEIRFSLTRSPVIVDLTHNNKLVFVLLTGLTAEKILLPMEHNISSIGIGGPNGMTTESVDLVINNVYTNTVNKNIMNGVFDLKSHWYLPEGEYTFVGPPSPAAMDKLKILKNDYGWDIAPDPDSL